MTVKAFDRRSARTRRHKRVRVHIAGNAERPRLAVFRSLHHIYAQLIDDESGRTLAAASTLELKGKANDLAAAQKVGEAIAKKAAAAGLKAVVFDRGGFLYHGRIRAVADAARKAGLEF